MKGFDVLKVKSAVKSRNKFDLSFSHLTTMDFGQIVPLFARELVPGDNFHVSADYFSRMAPLAKPTYGKFQFKTVAGFVPYHQVSDDFEPWIAGKSAHEGSTPHDRYILCGNMDYFIRNNCIEQAQSLDDSDYTYLNTSGTIVYNKFTNYGKFAVKVLNALGYCIPQGVDLRTTSDWYVNIRSSVKYSAFPLLAFFKLYNDYMSQSQRFNISTLSDMLRKIKHGIADATFWDSSTGSLTQSSLKIMFDALKLNYENDYFTSAWMNPNCPLQTNESLTSVNIPGMSSGYISNGTDANKLNTPLSSTNAIVAQRALDMLRDFDNWVRRNNYSGSRAVQQLYSRFGIKTDDYRTNYAHVISTDSMPIQVGDVTSTAETADGMLGEYSGKGIMSGSKGVSYSSDDFGCLFILGYFTVTPMNSFGFDRSVLRTNPLDYYTPEFDGLGADAISYMEVVENPLGVGMEDTQSKDTMIYGYTERYNSYRYGRDVITGEFRDYHNNAPMSTWHTGRNLNDLRKSLALVAQNSGMNTLEQYGSQYNRIFSVTGDYVDHFYLTCRFKVDAVRPMLNLNQVVNLGEGNTNVPRNGNTIS